MPINIGTQGGTAPIASVHEWTGSAFAPLKEGWRWTGTDWEPVFASWKDSGITKVGTQIIARGTWDPLSGWEPRAGFPGTVTESGGIRVPAGAYTFAAQVAYSANGGNNPQGLRVTLDGASLPGLEYTSGYTAVSTYSLSAVLPVAAGLVRLEAYSSSSLASRRTVLSGSTWLTVTAFTGGFGVALPSDMVLPSASGYTTLTGWEPSPEYPGTPVSSGAITLPDGEWALSATVAFANDEQATKGIAFYRDGTEVPGTRVTHDGTGKRVLEIPPTTITGGGVVDLRGVLVGISTVSRTLKAGETRWKAVLA